MKQQYITENTLVLNTTLNQHINDNVINIQLLYNLNRLTESNL